MLLPVPHTPLPPVEGEFEGGVAPEVVHEGDVHLVLDELEIPSELVLAPASHVTPHSGPITEK